MFSHGLRFAKLREWKIADRSGRSQNA